MGELIKLDWVWECVNCGGEDFKLYGEVLEHPPEYPLKNTDIDHIKCVNCGDRIRTKEESK